MQSTRVVAIQMEDRCNFAPRMQEVLTRHGGDIKVRLGVPDLCETKGLILLIVQADEKNQQDLVSDLRAVPGTKVTGMSL